MSQQAVDPDRALSPGNRSRWARVWAESGIKLGVESEGSRTGSPRSHLRPDGLPAPIAVGDAEVAVGDLVSIHENQDPSEDGQSLHRVIGLSGPDGPGGRRAALGPALPRLEWPDAIREATVPSSLLVLTRYYRDAWFTTVQDSEGRQLAAIATHPADVGRVAQVLRDVVSASAGSGRTDASEGRRRIFSLVAGRGGSGKDAACWQIVDDMGGVRDVERRTLLHRGPTKLAQAAFLVARAAYVEGMTEGLAIKARDEWDVSGIAEIAGLSI